MSGHAGRQERLALRKGRGAFFTPPEIADFLVRWAVRADGDRVLEPSCGEAAFLSPAARRLKALGRGSSPEADQVCGVDIHGPSARAAEALLEEGGYRCSVKTGDFFRQAPGRPFDAVVGNPPYIRYQQFGGAERLRALRAARAAGVELSRLASSWAAFVAHATRFLKPDGRLGLVLPAELLTVKYAGPVRRFLLERFGSVRLVLFEGLVFPGVVEDVALLMAEGRGSTPTLELAQVRDLAELADMQLEPWRQFAPKGQEKWTPALLSAEALTSYRGLVDGESFEVLSAWGELRLGAVTGNNGFFTLTTEYAEQAGISMADLLPISPPGSRHLHGLAYTRRDWEQHASQGRPCYLFHPGEGSRPAAVLGRIEEGETAGVHRSYKCRVRKPWWLVPVTSAPDLFLTYMDSNRPRLIRNEAEVRHLNSLYGVTLHDDRRAIGSDLLPLAALNSVTLLGAEMVGRSYGGGLLKLEPREAGSMPVPSAALLARVGSGLRAQQVRVSAALAAGELLTAVDIVDRELLEEGLALGADQLAGLRQAREVLFARRAARGRRLRDRSS